MRDYDYVSLEDANLEEARDAQVREEREMYAPVTSLWHEGYREEEK